MRKKVTTKPTITTAAAAYASLKRRFQSRTGSMTDAQNVILGIISESHLDLRLLVIYGESTRLQRVRSQIRISIINDE